MDLVLALAAAMDGELIEVPFPAEAEHLDVCNQLELWSSDPTTWPTKRRRILLADLEHCLEARLVA
jgi:hypothetical protein